MMRTFGFLFGLLLLALVFAGSVPRALKDAFKSVLAPAAYPSARPGCFFAGSAEGSLSRIGFQGRACGEGRI